MFMAVVTGGLAYVLLWWQFPDMNIILKIGLGMPAIIFGIWLGYRKPSAIWQAFFENIFNGL